MTRTRITTDGITDASVTTQKINDSAVTTGKIANAAVTDAKIADVAAGKITGQIATSQVADGAITDAKITSAGLATSSLNWSAIQPWAANTSYAKGALVEFQGIAYRRSAAGTSGATFNSANWQQITPSTYPNTLITGLGTMATATATDYLPRSGGTSNAMTGPLIFSGVGPHIRHSSNANAGILMTEGGGITLQDFNGNWILTVNQGQISSAIADYPANGTYPHYACRAWVNFNGTAASDLTGTYSRSGTTVTVTATAHGQLAGQSVLLSFTSGGISGSATYTITSVVGANTFTVTHGTSGTTSGNVTIGRRTIRTNGNVSSVQRSSVGGYVINFMVAMPDADYAVSALGNVNQASGISIHYITSNSIYAVGIGSYQSYSTPQFIDNTIMTVAVFR